MEDQILKHLYDVREAARAIARFVHGKAFEDYQQEELLRSGVERKFEIIGEALNRLGQEAPDILDQFREYRGIISFRNHLAHGYDTIDDRIVWSIIEDDLDSLLEDVERLIPDKGSAEDSP